MHIKDSVLKFPILIHVTSKIVAVDQWTGMGVIKVKLPYKVITFFVF